MKTVKNIQTGEIRRVTDVRAEEMVDKGALGETSGIFWKYVGKEVWKKEVRDKDFSAAKVDALVVPIDAETEAKRLAKIEAKKQKKEYQKQRKARTGN